jgi:uncharacterized membrane protein YbaN (DUF454 family)
MSKNLKNSSSRIKKALWYCLGMLSLAMAYIGFVTPGIPFSIFLVFSAYCFSKSSQKMHDWLYNHKHFGPFLTNWVEKRIFPQRMKYAMILVMSSSLAFLWFTTYNLTACLWSGGFMALVAIWAWRYPGSEEEYNRRKNGI